ncbi:ROK family protein [Solwaraspora sp. WMMA2080]|uniref:ROK family protein n=1 Tax=unclassified Solwaraspora TaxID=2627926 RepID=UPI00248CD045|nr:MULTISPECIES: ROK family protein [unclassified Solwaraspora]WBB98411.1 ROK family protein [Solwaraspora sp. WMMA2059]WBC23036.1 ROK family protein [Solwaraspora sp. WMMA2080]
MSAGPAAVGPAAADPAPGPVLAVDVGGTKLAAAVVEPDGTIAVQGAVPTPAGGDTATVTAALHRVVRQVVGDGHCMALGEHWRGGYPGRALLGMVVSTGVGGGLVIDGRVHPGGSGNAGHIGHIVVDMTGPACPCGGRGCVEAIASGPAMVRWAVNQGWTPGERPGDARTLAEDARAGVPLAVAAFGRGATALAAAVVSATALVDLDDVVIGGGVAAAGDLLFAPLRAAVAELAGLDFVRRVRIHTSSLGNDAGLLGAAALALEAAARQ